MRETLKEIVWRCNQSLVWLLMALPMIIIALSSLVLIVLSPLIAILCANSRKLDFPMESWWKLYKASLIEICTDDLPIVIFYNHF